MAGEASSSSAPPSEELSVNIAIVSPSLSANTPLNFPGLPASTTIGQLKQRIRETLDSKPSNDRQRLIHQGKLLARENETLLDVLGEQRVRIIISMCLGNSQMLTRASAIAPRSRTDCCTLGNSRGFGPSAFGQPSYRFSPWPEPFAESEQQNPKPPFSVQPAAYT